VALADGLRLLQEIRALAGVQTPGALGARGEKLLAARLERALQLGDQLERGQREDGLEAREERGVDLHALRHRDAHGASCSRGFSKKVRTSRRLVPTRVGSVSSCSSGRPWRFTHSVV